MRKWGENYGGENYAAEYDEHGWLPDESYGPAPAGRTVRVARVISGIVCGAVLVLTVVVCVATYLAGDRGFPGPGYTSLTVHLAATVVAVVAQVTADRKRGAVSLFAAAVVIFTASILMVTQWWG